MDKSGKRVNPRVHPQPGSVLRGTPLGSPPVTPPFGANPFLGGPMVRPPGIIPPPGLTPQKRDEYIRLQKQIQLKEKEAQVAKAKVDLERAEREKKERDRLRASRLRESEAAAEEAKKKEAEERDARKRERVQALKAVAASRESQAAVAEKKKLRAEKEKERREALLLEAELKKEQAELRKQLDIQREIEKDAQREKEAKRLKEKEAKRREARELKEKIEAEERAKDELERKRRVQEEREREKEREREAAAASARDAPVDAMGDVVDVRGGDAADVRAEHRRHRGGDRGGGDRTGKKSSRDRRTSDDMDARGDRKGGNKGSDGAKGRDDAGGREDGRKGREEGRKGREEGRKERKGRGEEYGGGGRGGSDGGRGGRHGRSDGRSDLSRGESMRSGSSRDRGRHRTDRRRDRGDGSDVGKKRKRDDREEDGDDRKRRRRSSSRDREGKDRRGGGGRDEVRRERRDSGREVAAPMMEEVVPPSASPPRVVLPAPAAEAVPEVGRSPPKARISIKPPVRASSLLAAMQAAKEKEKRRAEEPDVEEGEVQEMPRGSSWVGESTFSTGLGSVKQVIKAPTPRASTKMPKLPEEKKSEFFESFGGPAKGKKKRWGADSDSGSEGDEDGPGEEDSTAPMEDVSQAGETVEPTGKPAAKAKKKAKTKKEKGSRSGSAGDTDSDDDGFIRTPKTDADVRHDQHQGTWRAPCRGVEVYKKLNRIAEGAYGVVYRARSTLTGEIVALKKVKYKERDSREGFPVTALREAKILLQLNHENIVNTHEIVVGKRKNSKGEMVFDDSIYLVMDYVDHELKQVMADNTHSFSLGEIKCLMKQLLSAMECMHSNWVLHRDLKTSNLLYSNDGRLKVADFGLAREFGSPLQAYTSLVVTQWYRSPELLFTGQFEQIKYGTKVDMWSVGCIMGELLLKDVLFEGRTEQDQISRIFRLLGSPMKKGPHSWPDYDQYPLYSSLAPANRYKPKWEDKFPAGRITSSGLDLLKGMLLYDPEKRWSAERALDSRWFAEAPAPKEAHDMPVFASANEAEDGRIKVKGSPSIEEQLLGRGVTANRSSFALRLG